MPTQGLLALWSLVAVLLAAPRHDGVVLAGVNGAAAVPHAQPGNTTRLPVDVVSGGNSSGSGGTCNTSVALLCADELYVNGTSVHGRLRLQEAEIARQAELLKAAAGELHLLRRRALGLETRLSVQRGREAATSLSPPSPPMPSSHVATARRRVGGTGGGDSSSGAGAGGGALPGGEGEGEERLLTFIMQENAFDYGATGHSGGMRHWESQLFRLETIAEYFGRRLVLLPPALILDPKHLFGNVDHGWDLVYDRPFDDPRFRTWEDVVQQQGLMSRTHIDVRDPNAADQLRQAGNTALVVLHQYAVHKSAVWDQAPLFQMHRMLENNRIWIGPRTGKGAPPPPSRFVVSMGQRIVAALGSFITVHVRRGDVLGMKHRVFVAGDAAAAVGGAGRGPRGAAAKIPAHAAPKVAPAARRELGGLYRGQYTQEAMDEMTSVARIRVAIQRALAMLSTPVGVGGGQGSGHHNNITNNSANDPAAVVVVIFSNEPDRAYFDALRGEFPVVTEDELLPLTMPGNGGYHFQKVLARSRHSSSVFAMALNGYLAAASEANVCTVASTMYAKCDVFLRDL